MIQLIVLAILIGILIGHSRQEEKQRQEKIIQSGLDFTLQLYNSLKINGITEQQMMDKCYILPYDMNKLKERGMI
jgi:hypothetical protein